MFPSHDQDSTQDTDLFLLNLAQQLGATAEEMAFLATATGDFTQEQIDAAVKTIEFETRLAVIQQRFKDGEISVYQMRDAVQDLINEMNGLQDKTVTVTVNTVDNGGTVYQQNGQGPGISEYATGTSYHPGGRAIVGEYGPEMIDLPRGASVVSTNSTLNQSTTNNFNVTPRS